MKVVPSYLDAVGNAVPSGRNGNATDFETVAASQTAQALGDTGAVGDFLARLVIIPATTSPGTVVLLDDETSVTIFAGGASSVASLAPIIVEMGITSAEGAWGVTTGSNVSVVAVGAFT